MAEHDEMTALPARDDVPPPRRRLRFPVKTALALALITALGLPVFSLLQPGYYGRYPDLSVRIGNWKASTHARVPCSGCHVEPGVPGMARFAAHAVPAFYSQLIRGPRPANLLPVPGIAACRKCHTDFRQVSSSGDLNIPHKAHVAVLGIKCATCHEDLVHSVNDKGFNQPSMTMCLDSCHDGDRASAECVDCHTRKQVPDSHRSKDWLAVHSTMSAQVDCGECHAWSPDYCAECHRERPASHAGNWKKLHAPVTISRGAKGCTTCHDGAFCKECHD